MKNKEILSKYLCARLQSWKPDLIPGLYPACSLPCYNVLKALWRRGLYTVHYTHILYYTLYTQEQLVGEGITDDLTEATMPHQVLPDCLSNIG